VSRPDSPAPSPLPVVVDVRRGRPAGRGTARDTADALVEGRATVDEALLHGGAVLLRDSGVASPLDLGVVAEVVCGALSPYMEGSSERRHLAGNVYTSTEYPAELRISLHNELSYAARWPARVCFACVRCAATGGETPIADSRRILRELPGSIVETFERRGVCYHRNLRSRDTPGIGLSWQAAFETDDRAAVERHCQASEVELEWRDHSSLRTRQVRPAIRSHPVTGERVWFNQVDQFHPSDLGPAAAADLYELFGVDDLPLNSTYGDGGAIDAAVLDEIRAVSWGCAVVRPWEAGDVLILDNMLTAHGRAPFRGERSVLVALG
jgi:alpha-ketoglutarate-dependent taurine dioxygenase